MKACALTVHAHMQLFFLWLHTCSSFAHQSTPPLVVHLLSQTSSSIFSSSHHAAVLAPFNWFQLVVTPLSFSQLHSLACSASILFQLLAKSFHLDSSSPPMNFQHYFKSLSKLLTLPKYSKINWTLMLAFINIFSVAFSCILPYH